MFHAAPTSMDASSRVGGEVSVVAAGASDEIFVSGRLWTTSTAGAIFNGQNVSEELAATKPELLHAKVHRDTMRH